VFGVALIVVGSRFLVTTASELALRLGLSETAVGLTLIALGTSLPELATAIAAGLKGHAQLALGNLVGANALNLTLVIGLSGVLRPVPMAATVRGFDLPVVALLMALAALFVAVRRGVGRAEGGTLFVLYVIYVFLLVG
jgi:cation:H+ antiporter